MKHEHMKVHTVSGPHHPLHDLRQAPRSNPDNVHSSEQGACSSWHMGAPLKHQAVTMAPELGHPTFLARTSKGTLRKGKGKAADRHVQDLELGGSVGGRPSAICFNAPKCQQSTQMGPSRACHRNVLSLRMHADVAAIAGWEKTMTSKYPETEKLHWPRPQLETRLGDLNP